MKTTFPKTKPKQIFFWDYKYFDDVIFKTKPKQIFFRDYKYFDDIIFKTKPKQIFFRDYKYFDDVIFKEDLLLYLDANPHPNINFREFQKLFLRVLDTRAPSKMKYVRANEVPHMTKTLRKAIMTRSRLENKYQRTMSPVQVNFKKDNNCNRLYKRERKKYDECLNLSKIADNKKFWNTMKPFLTGKGTSKKRITLIEDNKIISDEVQTEDNSANY